MNPKFENLVIFEMANNHQGSVEHGLEIIRLLGEAARKHHINAAVKFQYRDLDTMIHPDYKDRTDVKHIPRFLSTRLTSDQFYTMVSAVREEGMLTMCTPFDEKSGRSLHGSRHRHHQNRKLQRTDWPLLEMVSRNRNGPVSYSIAVEKTVFGYG